MLGALDIVAIVDFRLLLAFSDVEIYGRRRSPSDRVDSKDIYHSRKPRLAVAAFVSHGYFPRRQSQMAAAMRPISRVITAAGRDGQPAHKTRRHIVRFHYRSRIYEEAGVRSRADHGSPSPRSRLSYGSLAADFTDHREETVDMVGLRVGFRPVAAPATRLETRSITDCRRAVNCRTGDAAVIA